MKISYYPETNSLYIDLSDRLGDGSYEISTGMVLDYDADGNLTGIDIDQASGKLNLTELELHRFPAEIQRLSA